MKFIRLDYPILFLAMTLLAACDRHPQSTQLASPVPSPPAAARLPADTGSRIQIHHVHHVARTSRGVETESSAYNYGGEGHEYGPEDEIRDSDDTVVEEQDRRQYSPIWTDAYGRAHFAFREEHQTPSPSDKRARLDPWHGYDAHDGPEKQY